MAEIKPGPDPSQIHPSALVRRPGDDRPQAEAVEKARASGDLTSAAPPAEPARDDGGLSDAELKGMHFKAVKPLSGYAPGAIVPPGILTPQRARGLLARGRIAHHTPEGGKQ